MGSRKDVIKEKTASGATLTVKGRNGGTLKPSAPGHTNNPNGRPKGVKFLTEMLKSEMNSDAEIIIEGVAMDAAMPGDKIRVKVKMPTHKQIIQALLRKAAKGDTKAIDMILDRVEGKVPLPIHGDSDHPLLPETPVKLTEKMIDRLIDKL